MARNQKSLPFYLPLLLAFGSILAENYCTPKQDCTVQQKEIPADLTCYTDFNYTISCVWNSTHEHQDSACTAEAVCKMRNHEYNGSCQLKSGNLSRPLQKSCTMKFTKFRFTGIDKCTITINCQTTKPVVRVNFTPSCHIKLSPPPKPEVNLTTIVWVPHVPGFSRCKEYCGQLQLRKLDEPWMDNLRSKECKFGSKSDSCKISINQPSDLSNLIKGETYEARIRVQCTSKCSTWSDWSPSKSWVSTIEVETAKGQTATPAPPSLPSEAVTLGTVAFLAIVVLTIIFIRTDGTSWIYIVKRIRGPPLPHPGKSFLREMDFKQNPKNPPFSSDSFHLLVKPVEIAQVEVTSIPNDAAPTRLEEKMQAGLTVKAGHPSTSSGFSNPIYSHLSPQLPAPVLLASGNLEATDADTPVGCRSADKNLEQDEESAILRLLKSSEGKCESTFVISDYEKVERAEMDRIRLQSLDSGVDSAEEVSQESLEADSITKAAAEDRDEKEQEENDFRKLFGGGGVVDKGSIKVCSGYNQIQKMQNDTAELLSLDSGISSGCGQLMNREDSLTEEEESALLLCSPHAPVLRCPSSALASLAVKHPGGNYGGPGEMLEKSRLMSRDRPVSGLEPSADEYLPVRWELKTDAENL